VHLVGQLSFATLRDCLALEDATDNCAETSVTN